MGIILDKLRERRQTEGNNIEELSTTWLIDNLKKPDSDVVRLVRPNQIVAGKFYFLFYDLNTTLSSSRMEQFSPILALKTAYLQNNPILWGFNFNFVPESIRVNWLDKLFSRFFQGVLQTNQEIEQVRYQKPLNLTYEGIYMTLANIGFEYSIREYRMDLIGRVYEIDMNQVDKYISFNTETFSGVDTSQLVKIWLAKLDEGEERLRKIKTDILTDFKKIDAEIEYSMQQMEKSKQFLATL